MDNRTKFSMIKNVPVIVRESRYLELKEFDEDPIETEAYICNCLLIARADNGKVVGMVSRDSLFDEHGNRFDYEDDE